MSDAPRILIGDDEPEICSLVRDALRSAGYDIHAYSNGRELLEHYRPGSCSLLILDTVLSQTSGMEVVMTLRDRGDDVPIILMSVPSDDVDRVEPFAFTYRVDVLRKPFGVEELRVAVRRAVGNDRAD